MRSPNSRIQQLKQEIADLEQKLVTSCSSKPEPPQPSPPQILPSPSPEETHKFTSRNSLPSQSSVLESSEGSKKLRILSVKKPIDLIISKPREKSASRCTNPNRTSEPDTSFQSSLQRKPVKEEFTISK